MKNVLKQWDRFGIYVLLMMFGGYSTVYPIVSLEQSSPYWASILLGLEFFCAGILLILGMFKGSGYRMAGLVVVCIGLSTISLVIAAYGGLRVLAYAFLFGAFAMQSVHDIRKEKRDRQERRDGERQLVEELTRLVDENGPGDKR